MIHLEAFSSQPNSSAWSQVYYIYKVFHTSTITTPRFLKILVFDEFVRNCLFISLLTWPCYKELMCNTEKGGERVKKRGAKKTGVPPFLKKGGEIFQFKVSHFF